MTHTDDGENYNGHGAALYNFGPTATTTFYSKALFQDNVGGFVSAKGGGLQSCFRVISSYAGPVRARAQHNRRTRNVLLRLTYLMRFVVCSGAFVPKSWLLHVTPFGCARRLRSAFVPVQQTSALQPKGHVFNTIDCDTVVFITVRADPNMQVYATARVMTEMRSFRTLQRPFHLTTRFHLSAPEVDVKHNLAMSCRSLPSLERLRCGRQWWHGR